MNDVSPGKITLMIGAAVTLVFSFLPWYSISGFGSKFSRSAWQSGTFPMATWAPIFAIAAGFIVAVQAFKFLELPEKIWEFTLDQVVLILSAFAFVVTLSYLIVDKGGASIGFGLVLCFLGTIAMVAGFFMDRAGVGVNPNAQNPTAPFGQGGYPQPGPGAPQPGQAPFAQSGQAPFQQPPAPMPQPPMQTPPTPQPPLPTPQPPADPGAGSF